MLPTVAVKVPVVCPAGIDNVEGSVTLPLLLNRATLAPPDGAGADKVIVQVADPGALTELGEQFTDVSEPVTVKLIALDCCWPFSVAVTLALCAVLRVPVVAEKVVLAWPVKMTTLEGTESAVVLLEIATVIELAAA